MRAALRRLTPAIPVAFIDPLAAHLDAFIDKFSDTRRSIGCSGVRMDRLDPVRQSRVGDGSGRRRSVAPSIVAMAWFAVINSKTETTSRRSEQTRPRPLPGYLSPSWRFSRRRRRATDPAMDRRGTRLEFSGQVFNAAPGTGQGNNLVPEIRRVRRSRSRHDDTLLSRSKSVHQTGGTPIGYIGLLRREPELPGHCGFIDDAPVLDDASSFHPDDVDCLNVECLTAGGRTHELA